MKALVTGATGFLGRHIIPALQRRNVTIVATALEENPASFPWLKDTDYRPFNLATSVTEENLFAKFGHPDFLVHLAWEGLPRYRELFHFETNLPRHYQFIKNLISHGLSDVTVAGTCLEYGIQEGQLTESLPSNPNNAYALAKDTLRKFLLELKRSSDFSLKWPRLFYLYGPGQNRHSLIPQLNEALAMNASVFNMSKGDQTRDFLPVEDAGRMFAQIACQKNVEGVINCCSGIPVSVKTLVDRHLEKINRSITLNLGYYPYPDFEPLHFWGSTTKLQSILHTKH
ncbi:MAG: SDR family oxidoreductase [Bacteroidia bacterium]|nr:SDR family oxidoreductase [Bacteroidia bacterium]